jgi:gliding motility-associated-like protein
MEMNDKLENAFKQALDNHELPYDAAAWNAVKKQVPAAKTPWYWIVGAAAVVLAVGLGVFMYDNESSENNQNQVSQAETNAVTNEVNADLLNGNSKIEDNGSSNNRVEPNVITQGLGANTTIDGIPPAKHSSSTNNSVATNQNNTNPWANGPINNPTPGVIEGVYSNRNEINPETEKPFEWLKECKSASISGVHSQYCYNSKVVLFAHKVPKDAVITWLFSDGSSMKGERIEFTASKDVKVRMKLTHVEDKNLSTTTDWSNINVIEADKPEFAVSITEKNTKTYVVLSNTNTNVEHLIWHVDNKVCQGQSCSTYMTQKGQHVYTVESYDRNGCFASTQGVVNIEEDYNLYVENTFTPNGDGINDVFLPEALRMRSVNFKMTIYDRNGKDLFETTDAARPWNGTQNGQSIEEGVYVWVVTLINEEGQPEQYRGVVNLKR